MDLQRLARYFRASMVGPVRPWLNTMLVEEHEGSLLYRSEFNPFFKTNSRLFPAMGFLVQLLRICLTRGPTWCATGCTPPSAGSRVRSKRREARSRGTGIRKPWLLPLAPGANAPPAGDAPQTSVSSRESRSAWTRLLAKVYELDAPRCSRCGSPMKVLAVITDPSEVRRILLHLIKTSLAPPDVQTSALI